jgi:DNA-binding LacI/PurR family transcriptional regulator
MADIAAEAGVSRASVSRVLRGNGRFSPETARKVMEAVRRRSYVPNLAASQLASRGTDSVGLLLRDASNPSYGRLFSELQAAGHRAGVALVTMTIGADDGGRLQVDSLTRLLGLRTRGLLVATGGVSTAQLRPFAERLPILRVGRPDDGGPIHAVSYDEEQHGRMLAAAVAAAGHRSVAVLTTAEDRSYPEFVRATSMAAELGQRAIRVVHVPVRGPLDGVQAAAGLAAAGRVTAIMCPSDTRQLEVLRALAAVGLRVPQDVSVTGCDGQLPGLDLLGLTTVRIPIERVAQRAIEAISALVVDPTLSPVKERHLGVFVPGRTLRPPAG